jgi:putative membrane protein
MAAFFTHDGKVALTKAVAAFESATSAELVISVRPRSDDYLHLNIAVGLLVGVAVLVFLLYGEPEFDLHWFIALPLVIGVLSGWGAGVAPLQRLLTRRATRDARVLRAARAMFVERSIADTRGRSGVLLYISLAERHAVFVPDLGVRERVPEAEWTAAADAIRQAVARGATAEQLAAPIAALGQVCGRHLPRAADDANELPDGVES